MPRQFALRTVVVIGFVIAFVCSTLSAIIATAVDADPTHHGKRLGGVLQSNNLYTCLDASGVARGGWTTYQRTCSGQTLVWVAYTGTTTTTTSTTSPPSTTSQPVVPTTNTQPPPTTTPPTTPVTVPAGDTRPDAAGYFNVLPPGAALPSDAYCLAHIHRSTWEPRPENTPANHVVTPSPNTLGNFGEFNSAWNSAIKPRIGSDQFTGTTDEEVQMAACKFGWSDNIMRAEMIVESNWYQNLHSNGVPVRNAGFGDYEAASNGHCPYTITIDPCPTSYGILQVRWYYHPQGFASSDPRSSWPWITDSTLWNLEQQAAAMRGCYNGQWYPGSVTTGDIWGCIQSWFSGSYTSGGSSYSQSVKNYFNSEPWESWSG